VDEASLKQMNPNVILSLFTAFGGPGWGPKSDHIGYDDLVQAHTGIMARFGGGLRSPEEHAHLGTIDVVSGFSGALAVCYALLKRRRTGQCDRACSSLAANGQLIQTQYVFSLQKAYSAASSSSLAASPILSD
jgi:crotonobetainyl-CoA:carnitine CoA-transferase CaiB-like acyl-CoA transferase